jgi:diguanylate cyclase (GGDEF)-like protein
MIDIRLAEAIVLSAQLRPILIVEDERIVAIDLQRTLQSLGYDPYAIAASGAAALTRAAEKTPDLALMDIHLKGALDGVETAVLLRERFGAAIVFLTAYADDSTIERVKQSEPYGYLVKPVTSAALKSTIELSLHRHVLDQRLRNQERELVLKTQALEQSVARNHQLSVTDELTGLHNRRGLQLIGKHHLKIARRADQQSVMFFFDLDGLKRINDRFGHAAGDEAICDMARILKQTFRESDVLVRMGGDEFVVLASMPAADVAMARTRLHKQLERFNACGGRPYKLVTSIGAVAHAPQETLDALLTRADAAMYLEKCGSRRGPKSSR